MDKPYLCVLCFSENTCSNLVDTKSPELLTFSQKFNLIFQFKIRSNADSKFVCRTCVHIIEEFAQFYDKVVENQEKVSCYISKTSSINRCIDKAEGVPTAIQNEDQIQLNDIELDNSMEVERESKQCHLKENNPDACKEKIFAAISDSNVYTKIQTNNPSQNECKFQDRLPEMEDSTVVIEKDKTPDASIMISKIDLPNHLNIRTPKKISDAKIRAFMDLICEICSSKLKFNTFRDMQMHYLNEHGTRGFITCCGKKIYRKDRAMDHITLHMNPDAFKCPKCGQRSKSKVLLRIHIKQHLPVEERAFQCPTCGQRFVLRSQLNNHLATHLSEDEKKYVCDECGKAFALKFVLLKHKVIHTPEKPYFCEICAKTFSNKGNLMSHVKMHTVEPQPRVQCEECGQWYKNQQTLRSHVHRHRDTRDHICDICSKKCCSKSSLIQHIKYVHEKVRNFECNICQKQFRRRPELTEHVARHTGEILYKCKYCPKTFFSSSNYFAHRKKKHPNEIGASIGRKL